jgi:hypothetical protein
MEGDFREIAAHIQRRRQVEGKSFGIVLQFLKRLLRAAYEKDRYFLCRGAPVVPCEQARLWRITYE